MTAQGQTGQIEKSSSKNSRQKESSVYLMLEAIRNEQLLPFEDSRNPDKIC